MPSNNDKDGARPSDPSSCANFESYKIKSAEFDLTVDTKSHQIHGTVVYVVNCAQKHGHMFLDVKYLDIQKCVCDGKSVHFAIESTGKELGDRLKIPVECDGDKVSISITFSTTSAGKAVQWLTAEMTQDRKMPFFFTQLQSVLARSLYPCQDTPMIKFTYTAKVHFPRNIDVILAAVRKDKPAPCHEHPDCLVVHYEQDNPVPSYLFAMAGGCLASRSIGPRSTVWAEPSVVDEAADEFADCEKMLATAEDLCGPYRWGVYDILVLPPSFPYGGMENPNLTFVTPTLLTGGERSLVNVIAHEISHSWTGNLVTNCSWEHFWLNEGHTTYLERLIIERLYGPEMRALHMRIGFEELLQSLDGFGHQHEFTKMVPNLQGVHPDESYSRVPYEKGSLLLYYLETLFGRDQMLAWLKAYLAEHAGTSLDTDTWLAFLKSRLGEQVEHKVDWNAWLYTPGLPPYKLELQCNLLDDCEKARVLCEAEDFSSTPEQQKQLEALFSRFEPKQKEYFFRILHSSSKKLVPATLDVLERLFQFTQSRNTRIRLGFALLVCKSQHDAYESFVLDFINSNGVMKFIRPIYRSLLAWPAMREKALANYEKTKPCMHPTTARLVALDIGL